jgi:hypothetical protein
MARPKATKETKTETTAPVEEKAQPKPSKEVLVKVLLKSVVPLLIAKGFEVVHITGNGQSGTPKIFFLKGNGAEISKLLTDEQEAVVPAETKEIEKRVGLSIEMLKKQEAQSMAQKRKKGAPIEPSEFH